MPTLHPDTKSAQAKLAAYCRDGELKAIPGARDERLPHYRRLVFQVVSEALSSTYPLTKNLLTQKEWNALCQGFFAQHPCTHPQVWRMPEELIHFVKSQRKDLLQPYPHLMDLLQLEWLEVAYYMMPDRPWSPDRTTDSWTMPWNINPESEVYAFHFPVHLQNARYISRSNQGNYHCLIFRQPESFKVKFLKLSPFLGWLLINLRLEPRQSVASLLPAIQREFGLDDVPAMRNHIEAFFSTLESQGMVR